MEWATMLDEIHLDNAEMQENIYFFTEWLIWIYILKNNKQTSI